MKLLKIIPVIVIIGAVGGISWLAAQNVRPYVDVSTVVASPVSYDQHVVEIIGIAFNVSSSSFLLTENDSSIVVDASHVTIPQDLNNGTQVVVRGTFNMPRTLVASTIFTQCSQAPSNATASSITT